MQSVESFYTTLTKSSTFAIASGILKDLTSAITASPSVTISSRSERQVGKSSTESSSESLQSYIAYYTKPTIVSTSEMAPAISPLSMSLTAV